MPGAELAAYCDRLNEIADAGGKIKLVQAYTVARPTPEPYATALPRSDLDEIGEAIRIRTGLPVSIFE